MPHNFVRMSTSEEKRICEGVSDKLLDSRVSDVHIAEIATDLVDWELLAPGISLTQSEQKEIREDFEGRYNLQKRQALRVWRWKNGDKATYRQLIGVCCGQGKVDLAESIVKYLGPEQRPRSSLVLNDTFYRYLLDCYSVISHPSIKQWPSKAALHINIPHAYFDLILYDAPLNIPNSILPSNESCFKAVTLHDALTKSTGANRLLVYFEGIAGSGKTTLSWHACREWGQKRILQHFKLLIHIELSNPKVKEATNLADIIPYPDEALRQTIATEIVDRKGEGICLLLDGLDEAPTPLLDFLLVDLIRDRPGTPQVPDLSFVMTARLDSRVTERLEPVLHSRVIINGFNGENLHQFLDQNLGVDTKMRMKLKEKCEINPKLEGLCSLPINAVIMSFLIHCIEDVGPATQTDLYKPFVSNFLVRHLDVRQALAERPLIECLLNDVPVEIRGAFKKICSLAYHSSLEGKQLFTKRELGQSKIDIDNTLGLLQVHPQITMYGSERYYKFFHLSLQEFLAAVYLSKKNENAQITAIDEILNKNPLSQVLHFYAGLTRLSNRQALKLLSQSLSQSADLETIRRVSPHSDDPHSWPSAKALTFLNCLYESQNKDVFNLPETYLCSNPRIREEINKLQMQTKGNLLREDGPGTLTLAYLPLTPIDCLSIGYYARINSLISRPSVPLQCYYLSRCSIDHIGISALFTELKKDICQCTPGRVGLSLTGNTLHHVSLPLLKDLLQGQSNLEVLMLSRCFLPADLHCALKYLTEGLSKNSSCRYITLSANYLSTSHVHHLILMLRANPQLRSLDLSYQDLRREMHLLWKAIQLLPNLRNLNMDSCNIHDPELALLQKVVESHHKLSDLSIYGNHFTDRGLDNLLEVLKCNHTSSLSRLGLGVQLNEAEEVILREINEFRAANGHRLLTPTGFVDAKLAKEYESTLNEFRDKNLMSDPREHLLVMTTSSSLPSTNVGNQGYCYVSAASTWDLQGVEICGETSVVVYSSRAQQFEWEGFGLKLYIHEGSLPVGMEQCILQIKASLAGLYEFPEDSHLISAVFWFRCKTVHKFIKPITVEIQHCAKAKNISELNFVRAFCSQKQLPYTFKQIAGGNFKSRKSCGVIDLTSFSGIAAIQNKSEERDYCSIVFYHGERRVDMYRGEKMVNIFYVIVWNTEAHLNFVYECYKEMGALSALDQAVEFEEDRIELDIPMDGVTVKGGWQITPLIPPVIMKKNVDSYEPKKRIPNCQLAAKAMERGVPDLIYRVKLIGARYPQTEFVIYLSPSINAEYPQAVGTVGSATSISAFKADHQHKTRSSELESASEDRSSLISASKYASETAENITSSTSHSDPSSTIIVSELVTRLNPGAVSLSHLNLIKWKDASGEIRRLHLIEEMSHKWCSIGGIIGMSHSVLENIVEKNRGNPEECCRAVLGRWLDNPPPDYPTTWQGLLELLEDSQLCKVASDLKKLLNNVMV